MGKTMVDNVHAPAVFQIEVGPFNYFAGDPSSDAGKKLLEALEPNRLVMPSAEGWIEAIQAKFKEDMIGFDRYRFSADSLSRTDLQTLIDASPLAPHIKQIDLNFAEQIWGTEFFIDLGDYESAVDFCERGVGYYFEEKGKAVGGAYASLVCSEGIEVSLFVQEAHRQRGIASLLSGKLLLWCLERGLRPNWDAANPISCKLAEKLGYTPSGTYRAFYIRPSSSS